MFMHVRASGRGLILVAEMLRKRLLTCLSFLGRVSQDSVSEQTRRAETPPHGDAGTTLKYASLKITIPFKMTHIQEKKGIHPGKLCFVHHQSTHRIICSRFERGGGSEEGQQLAKIREMM